MGMIVAREVAVATSIADSGDTPKLWKRKKSTGTMTIPPPTPSNPARIPAKIPVTTKPTKVGKSADVTSMIAMAHLPELQALF